MRRIEILAGEDPFAFVHPLVRRSVYDALSVAERDGAHTAAAAAAERARRVPEAVAAHVAAVRPAGSAAGRGGPCARPRARPWPGPRRRRLSAGCTAPWRRSAAEPPPAVLLHELGEVELFSRDAGGHRAPGSRARARDGARAARRITLDLAEILVASGQWERGVGGATAALDELGDAAPEMALELEAFVAVSRAFDPRSVAVLDRDRPRLRALAGGDSWAARALAVLLAGNAAARGARPGEVRGLVEHGLRDGRLLAERGAGGWASAHALMALVVTEDDDRALEVADELAAHARRSGALIGTMTALGYRGWLYARHGALAAAEAELRPMIEFGVEHGLPLNISSGVWFLVDAMLERPSLDDLAPMLEAFDVEPLFLATGGGAMLVETRGRLRLARGDHEGALADLRACAATYGALGFGPPFSCWRSALALALPASAHDEALALVDEELTRATATGLPRPRGVALRAAGMVKGGEQGLTCLRESVALLEATPARLEHARSLVELGAALRRGGQRGDARGPLAAGRSWPTAAVPSGSRSGQATSCAPPAHARAASPALASTR